MTKTQHTPGPWRIETDPSIKAGWRMDLPCIPIMASHQVFALGQDVALVPKGNDANARLIAAAPMLLEALQSILEWMEQYHPVAAGNCTKARTAIKQATGE